MTLSPAPGTRPSTRPRSAPRPRWRTRLAQVDHFGWGVALVLAGLVGWLAYGVATTQLAGVPAPRLAAPARNAPAVAVAGDPTAAATNPAPATQTADSAAPTVLPTVTALRASATPRDTAAVPNGWAAGTVLYVTAETGYYANIFDPPPDPTQLQPGDTVTVELARQRRGYFEWVEFDGERWWFVDGWGWLPEAVLSETPP